MYRDHERFATIVAAGTTIVAAGSTISLGTRISTRGLFDSFATDDADTPANPDFQRSTSH